MKTILLCCILCTSMIAVHAQKSRVGFSAGANFSKIKAKDATEAKFLPGVAFGLITEIEFGKVSVNPSIYYSQKGEKFAYDDGSFKMKINYFELPVNILYKGRSGMNSWFAGGGPYIASAAIAKSTLKKALTGKEMLNIGKDKNHDIHPKDLGLNAIVGYRLANGVSFSLNYSHGLYNINPARGNDDVKLYNRTFGIKIGYFFKGLKD